MEFEYEYQRDRRRKRRKSRTLVILSWVLEVVVAIVLAYIITNVVLERSAVLGDSMSPTLNDKESIVINRMIYKFSDPERGDVIVIKQNSREHDFYDVKRVIGLPGDNIQIKDGEVYVNGELYKEIVNCEKMLIAGLAKENIQLEENEYFVLGDNRNNSEDSRFANIGMIIRENIIGKAWLRLSPFGIVSTLNQVKEEEPAAEKQ